MSFKTDLQGWSDKTKQGMDKIVRQAVVLAAQGVVMKSPVGNPDLWKVPRAGYVGGRLRASWNLGIGRPDETTTFNVDPSGSTTIAKIVAGMQGQKAGSVYYVTTSLAYAQRIEYEGWSSQAPSGMVRITFLDLPAALERYSISLR